MNIKAVVFDLDGTLTDTLEDLKDSVNFALRFMGFPERSADEVRGFVGNGVRRLIFLSVPDDTADEVSEKCLKIFKEYYKEHSCIKTMPYDGIIQMLRELKNKGVKTAVVTNKMHSAAVDIVNLFFEDLIEITVGQIDGVAQKPQPDGVFFALEKLGVQKENAAYVGDSEVDCITAHNAGIPCIAVSWGFRDEKILRENAADYIVNKPEEIIALINLI